MKTFIVKRVKDGQYLTIDERNLEGTLNRSAWNGLNFVKEFILIGEEKDRSKELADLFDDVDIKPKKRGRPSKEKTI